MKRIFFLFVFLFSSLFVHSQTIVDTTIQGVNCNNPGSIYLDIPTVGTLTLDWQFYSSLDSVWLGSLDTMSGFQFLNLDKDSLETTQCGTYRVIVAPSDTSFFYISCPLGSRGRQVNILCYGDSTGLIKRVAHSGKPPYTYEWFKDGIHFPPNTNPTNDTLFDNLVTGNYGVKITDDNGCTDSVGGNISSPDPLVVDSIISTDINCRGTDQGGINFIISGGKTYVNERYNCFLIHDLTDTVAWVTRDSLSLNCIVTDSLYQIDSLRAGEYTLSIVDSNECTLDTLFEVIEPAPYEAYGSTIGGMLICESDSGYFKIDSVIGDSVLGSENIAFGFAYDTIIGINIDSIYVPSDWHPMYVYDSTYSCLDTVQIRSEALYNIEVYETITPVNCFGDSTGEIVIDSINNDDGNAPFDVQWGGVNSSALSAGTYEVHIVDAIGCLKIKEYVVSEEDLISPNEVLFHPICYTDTNGSITINISGGVFPYSYSLNGMSQVNSLNGLSAGLYPLYVEDDNGCLDTFYLSLQVDTLVVSAENYQSQLSCFGELTTADLLISGGTTPYSILWDDGDTNLNRVVGAGSYTIEVTDSNGCAAQDLLIIITEPDSLSISIADTAISCTDGGVATAIVSGGVAPFSYLWNTGDTTQTIDSLWASVYWVIVTDSCGNSTTDTVYFDEYELFVEVYYDDSTHIVEVEIDSTTTSGPFEHIWYDESQGSLHDSIGYGPISPVLCEGTYFVVTTDVSNNCFVVDTFDVEFYLPLNGIVDITTTTVFPNSDLWGFDPYVYLWDNGEVTQHANICPGFHWVEVTDKDGCTLREDFEIEELIISLDPASVILECNLENLDICIKALPDGGTDGGIGTYFFEWWNGETADEICSGIMPGNLNVIVEDANGCKEDTSFVITSMTSECIPNVFTPDGDGMNDTWSLEDAFLFSDSEIRIYGRYGKLLFESVGYNQAWDGTNEKGNDIPDGAYFYSIDIGHGVDPIKGTVTILR